MVRFADINGIVLGFVLGSIARIDPLPKLFAGNWGPFFEGEKECAKA
jgi:hypothetical protein